MFTGDIRPHYYCLPVAKRERHRLALKKAATPGAACFFLGTDTARLARHAKEAAWGCAGMFVTPVALQCYAQVFDEEHALGHLEAFASLNGPRFYSLPTNGESSPSSGGASRSSRRRRLGRSTIGSCPSWPVSIQLGRWGALENGDERRLSRPRSRRRADRAHAVRGARCSRELGQPLHPRRGLGEAGLHRLPPADRVPASAGRTETAGIPFAASIADRLMLPMQYVGKHPLAIGRNAQVERIVGEGARTLLVDDLATDGRCKVGFVRGLCEAGAQVQHMLVILYHAVFPGTAERLRQLEVELHPLATWVDVLRVAAARNYLDGSTCAKLERFFADPAAWSAAHGRAAAPAPLIGHD